MSLVNLASLLGASNLYRQRQVISVDQAYGSDLTDQQQMTISDSLTVEMRRARREMQNLWEDSLMGQQPGMSHVGTVREFRKKFREYSKAEFRDISNKPIIKDILSGMTKLNKEEIKDRIAEYMKEAA